jgi:hypothetical protein
MISKKETYGKTRCGKQDARAGEQGFAMVLVLAALLMLSVLGATSLLLMVSTLKGVESNKPEDRAFQIAKGGLNVAHAMIVAQEIGPAGYGDHGYILGGRFDFFVEPGGGYEYTITSSGEYVENGTVYRRRIQETAMYSAERSFDAIRNYMFYAGRDLTINVEGKETANFNKNEMILSGGLRAERNLLINVAPEGNLKSLTVNGNVEGKESVRVISKPGGQGASYILEVNLFGGVRSGDIRTGEPEGSVTLITDAAGNATATIKAATDGPDQKVTSSDISIQKNGNGEILTGERIDQPGMEKVFIPEPDLAYYKALAISQNNYHEGPYTVDGSLGAMGVSSLSVVYCTGDMTLNSVTWDVPNLKGIFVCEGDFYTSTGKELVFEENSLFQVIAKGNISFDNDWSFPKGGSTSEFFFWSGENATIEMAMFADQLVQCTAVQDINIQYTRQPSHKFPCEVYYRGPDIDIAAWPVDIKVTDWKELPSHE